MRLPAVLLTAALASTAVPASAQDWAPGAGRRCEVTPAQVTTSPTWRDGVLSGGPYVVPAYQVTLTCSVVVGGEVYATAGKAAHGAGVVAPRLVSWPDLGHQAFVCTSVAWDYGPFLPIVGGTADLGCSPVE